MKNLRKSAHAALFGAAGIALATLLSGTALAADVTQQRLENADAEPQTG